MSIEIKRTNSENTDFILLVKSLDAYLKIIDGDEHDFYNQYNTLDVIKHAVVIYKDKEPVGCGGIKQFDKTAMEIKRMYVSPKFRNLGIAKKILEELEKWTKELGYQKSVLETGARQKEAVNFYKKNHYRPIANYGQYKNVANSLCFEKQL